MKNLRKEIDDTRKEFIRLELDLLVLREQIVRFEQKQLRRQLKELNEERVVVRRQIDEICPKQGTLLF